MIRPTIVDGVVFGRGRIDGHSADRVLLDGGCRRGAMVMTRFAMVVIVNLTFGLLTPPVGGLIFVIAAATNQKPAALIRELPPFFLAAILVLLVLTFVPALSTWLPAASGYGG